MSCTFCGDVGHNITNCPNHGIEFSLMKLRCKTWKSFVFRQELLPLWGIRFILRPNHSACFNFHLNSESYDCKFPSSEIQVQLICDGAVIRVTASVLKTLSFVSRDVQRLAEI